MKVQRTTRSQETQARILDTAEQLFAERGLEAASMRAITSTAQVNLAAVNYHFGSKEGLMVAVFARRLWPVNQMRLAALTAAEQAAGDQPVPVEAILEAFIGPVIDRSLAPDDGERFARLFGRACFEPGAFMTSLLKEELEPVLQRFVAVLARAIPGVSREDLQWRLHVAGGTLAISLAQLPRANAPDAKTLTARLVGFVAPGVRG